MKSIQGLERQSQRFIVVVCLGVLALIGAVDYLTGFEIFFSVFYLLGIGLAVWYVGRGFGLLMSILSVAVLIPEARVAMHL